MAALVQALRTDICAKHVQHDAQLLRRLLLNYMKIFDKIFGTVHANMQATPSETPPGEARSPQTEQ
jgi:hypothetical protein